MTNLHLINLTLSLVREGNNINMLQNTLDRNLDDIRIFYAITEGKFLFYQKKFKFIAIGEVKSANEKISNVST